MPRDWQPPPQDKLLFLRRHCPTCGYRPWQVIAGAWKILVVRCPGCNGSAVIEEREEEKATPCES